MQPPPNLIFFLDRERVTCKVFYDSFSKVCILVFLGIKADSLTRYLHVINFCPENAV